MTMLSADFADRFPLTSAVIQQGIDRGLHHGAQVYLSRHGEVLADVGIGRATPHDPMTPDVVMPWLSAGKPLTAVLIGRLQQAGKLDWDDSVAKFIPAFGVDGKDVISIRHLLTHTAGLYHADHGWPEMRWDDTLSLICEAKLPADWILGESAAYDPQVGWFLLGEIVQRLEQEWFSDVLAATFPGVTAGDRPYDSPAITGWMWERVQGQLAPIDWHTSPRAAVPSPGGSLRGPIRALGQFYERLLLGDEETESRIPLAAMTSRHRIGKFDQTFGHFVDFGLGFILDSNRYGVDTVPYGYGRFCSPRTFGHGGSQSSQGYCDPEHGLVVAYVFNGRPGEPQHQRRARAFNVAVYRDLGIA